MLVSVCDAPEGKCENVSAGKCKTKYYTVDSKGCITALVSFSCSCSNLGNFYFTDSYVVKSIFQPEGRHHKLNLRGSRDD